MILVGEINERVEKDQRVFVTTLTKKMAEDLTDYFKELRDTRVSNICIVISKRWNEQKSFEIFD